MSFCHQCLGPSSLQAWAACRFEKPEVLVFRTPIMPQSLHPCLLVLHNTQVASVCQILDSFATGLWRRQRGSSSSSHPSLCRLWIWGSCLQYTFSCRVCKRVTQASEPNRPLNSWSTSKEIVPMVAGCMNYEMFSICIMEMSCHLDSLQDHWEDLKVLLWSRWLRVIFSGRSVNT